MAPISQHYTSVNMNDGTALQDITSNVIDCNVSVTSSVGTWNTQGTAWQKAEDGAKGAVATLTIEGDNAAGAAATLFRDWGMAAQPGARAFEMAEPDLTSGSRKVAGNWRVQSFQTIQGVGGSGDVKRIPITMVSDGTLTESTIV